MGRLIIPSNYSPTLNLIDTQIAIKEIKDYFESELAKELNLVRVSAPLFVKPESGLNDNLNGVERPVGFTVKDDSDNYVEIVHSLAKWKRMALKRYGADTGQGLYTDMNAIRRDEELDNLHSIYVDQWDWEKVINKSDRSEEFLKTIVKKIYGVFKRTDVHVSNKYSQFKNILPEDIYFITTQELENKYPNLTPKEREDAITKEKIAVFIMKIGGTLESGIRHDGRAPDYDDWNLNGDILFWNETLNRAFELSSMGIRVDEDSMKNQLKISNCEDRVKLSFHSKLLNGELPYTIGGGIGQSRICMYFLRKAHIGEVQSSIWSDEMINTCEKNNIHLL